MKRIAAGALLAALVVAVVGAYSQMFDVKHGEAQMVDTRPQIQAAIEAIAVDLPIASNQTRLADKPALQATLGRMKQQIDIAIALAAQLGTEPTPTQPPVWIDYTPPPAKVGVPYSYQFKATGALSYNITGGTVPPVITLDQYTGLASGIPIWAGTYVVHLRAENTAGITYQFSVTITVSE